MLPDDPRSPPAPFADAITALSPSVRGLLGAGVTGTADRTRCLELAFRLHRYWASTNVGEGCFWLARLLESRGDEGEEWAGYATYALGYLNYWAGDDLTAVPHLELRSRCSPTSTALTCRGHRSSWPASSTTSTEARESVALVRQAIESSPGHGFDLRVSAAMGLGSVLAERGDPEAADYAAGRTQRCEEGASAEQLTASLPTAAMVAWQVGDLDRVRRWVARAMPLHTEQRRIARVVLLSAACGLHLADEDLEAAVEVGRSADLEGTELGIERELPLVAVAPGAVPAGARRPRRGRGPGAGRGVGESGVELPLPAGHRPGDLGPGRHRTGRARRHGGSVDDDRCVDQASRRPSGARSPGGAGGRVARRAAPGRPAVSLRRHLSGPGSSA